MPGARTLRVAALGALALLAGACAHRPPDPGEERLRAALDWAASYLAEPAHLARIGPDYLLMLDELRLNPGHRHLARRAGTLLRRSARRMAGALPTHFPPDARGQARFVAAAPYLYRYGDPARLDRYYRLALAGEARPPAARFAAALVERDYGALTDALLEGWAVRRLAGLRPSLAGLLPRVPWRDWLAALTRLPWVPPAAADVYSAQAYFATHLVYALSDFGARPPPDGVLAGRLASYLWRAWPDVAGRLNDTDLLAEFVHCLKILGHGADPRLRAAQARLARRQRPNGGFAGAYDLIGDPYDRFHPTWTVLTALNYPPSGPPAPGTHESLLGLIPYPRAGTATPAVDAN